MTGPTLSPEELRVLGCLAEKEKATPQNYPLTLNALRLACNQATGRDPVVDYDERVVESAVSTLKDKGFLRFVYSTSNRATKYRHILNEYFGLDDAELAVLTVLILRGPQTAGEIKGRTERLYTFADLGSVEAVLDRLAGRDEPLVLRLSRQPGQKEARFAHLLGRDEHEVLAGLPAAGIDMTITEERTATIDRIESLEAEVASLRHQVEEIRRDLDTFRAEFG
ncbi:MAG: YceH family protein [Acidimicrobiales bacterium]|nr:YceH family protein [Acidimicrobiales bacterium]